MTEPLSDERREKFCIAIAKGTALSEAYIGAGYSPKSAAGAAARMHERSDIQSRILFLRRLFGPYAVKCAIREVDERIRSLQHRWDLLRQIIAERSVHPDFQNVPGGRTGLLYIDYRGKNGDIPVYKVDGVLLTALLQHEERAARELHQWLEEEDKGNVSVKVDVNFVSATSATITRQGGG